MWPWEGGLCLRFAFGRVVMARITRIYNHERFQYENPKQDKNIKTINLTFVVIVRIFGNYDNNLPDEKIFGNCEIR